MVVNFGSVSARVSSHAGRDSLTWENTKVHYLGICTYYEEDPKMTTQKDSSGVTQQLKASLFWLPHNSGKKDILNKNKYY